MQRPALKSLSTINGHYQMIVLLLYIVAFSFQVIHSAYFGYCAVRELLKSLKLS
jgi:hypothetical protein